MNMLRVMRRIALLVIVGVLALLPGVSRAQGPVEIGFYYATTPGSALSKVIDGYAAEFNKANPDVRITPVYAGDYPGVLAAVQSPNNDASPKPDVAVMLSSDLYTLTDADLIVPMDPFIQATSGGDAYVKDFYPGFMANSAENGKVWAIPFQRSTPVLYYNKDLFKAAGLSADGPQTFQDLLDDAKKLTKPDGSQWGLELYSDVAPSWLFQGFAIANGRNVVGDDPGTVYFNAPEVVDALTFVGSMVKAGVMPTTTVSISTASGDFTSGKTAMIYFTTGGLTNILKNAKFDVGVAFLPKGKVGYGAPTGGGNLYIMKAIPADHQQAAWRWIQFLTTPDKEADWTTNTGFVAPRQSAWNTAALQALIKAKPQYAVARDQLQYAQKELATHSAAAVQKILSQAVQLVLSGKADAKTALDEAQKAAEAVLAAPPGATMPATATP